MGQRETHHAINATCNALLKREGTKLSSKEIWHHIHGERVVVADMLESLSDAQWTMPSLCGEWTIAQVAGHVLSAAEQTFPHFYLSLARAGFNFDRFTDTDAKYLGALPHRELIQRLRARTTTTNHPPAPVAAMLGEIVVHGEDIRRPLHIVRDVPTPALIAVANNFHKSNIIIPAKRRLAGLRCEATDADWSSGAGPAVRGPLLSLILVMTGRTTGLASLEGEGVPTLAARISAT